MEMMKFSELADAVGETTEISQNPEGVAVNTGDFSLTADDSPLITMLAKEQLRPNPSNPRIELGDLDEMTESIKKSGILQNLVVIPDKDEHTYMILIGHRRFEAGKRAGLTNFPCKILDEKTASEQMSIMLEENLQRSDLTAFEQGQGFQMMLDLGETENSISEKTGFSKSTIRRRINIAMLDKDILQEKENDDCFQLNLTDLFSLEKVDDLAKRNEILQNAETSEQIQYKVNNYIKEQERKKNREDIVKWLKDSGIPEATDKQKEKRYSSKFQCVKSFHTSGGVDQEFQIPEGDLFYIADSYSVGIYEVKKKEKKEKTPEEIRRDELKSRAKKANKIYKDTCEKRREFILDLVDGKYKIPKDTKGMMVDLWKMLVDSNRYGGTPNIGRYAMRGYLCGDGYYSLEKEEQEKIDEKIDAMHPVAQMIVCLAKEQKIYDMAFDSATYREEEAKKVQDLDKILSKFGFVLSEEEKAVLDGSSELYEKASTDAA